MKEKIINALLTLFFEGPAPVAKEMIKKGLYQMIDEDQIGRIILDFTRMIETDSLKEEVKRNMESCSRELRKIVKEGNLEVLDQIKEIIMNWLQNDLNMDEMHQKRLCDVFLQMMLWYIKKKDQSFYRDLRIFEQQKDQGRRITLLENAIEDYIKVQQKEKEFRTHLDAMGQSSVHIDNVERIQDRPEDRDRIEQTYRQGQRVVFLYGDPGMGKTVLAKKYANKGGYEKVFFLSYEHSFEYTLKKLLQDEVKGSIEDILEYFCALTPECKESTLLIIDNFNDDTYDAETRKYDEELNGKVYSQLLNTGIRLLITTRIGVGGNQQVVEPLENVRELFFSCCDCTEEDQTDERIDELIDAVGKNTLLVTLLAHIWEDSTEEEKAGLLQKLKKGEMAEDEHEIAIETGRGYPAGTATFYHQLEEIFHYGPVLKSEGRKRWMASAALLPLEGMEKEEFLLIMEGLDRKELKDLFCRRWISSDGKRVYVHAGIREVTRRNPEVITYERCRQFCHAIGEKLDVDRVEKLHERIRYRAYGQEIYYVFPEEKDEALLWMYYNLSDIYDHQKEKELANQLAQVVLNQIEVFGSDATKTARILSGVAYSKIQSAKSEEALEEPEEMLKQAEKILKRIPVRDRTALDDKIRGKVYSNQGAYMQKIADIRKGSSRDAYRKSKEKHLKTLEYRREMVENWENRVSDHEYYELLKDKALSYKNVATEEFHLGEYEEAIKNHKKAIDIYRRLGETSSCAFIQKLLIGCVLFWYRTDLEFRKELMEEVLDCYPTIVKIFKDNGQTQYMEESRNSFNMIKKIMEIDRRGEEYLERVKEIEQLVRENYRNGCVI